MNTSWNQNFETNGLRIYSNTILAFINTYPYRVQGVFSIYIACIYKYLYLCLLNFIEFKAYLVYTMLVFINTCPYL